MATFNSTKYTKQVGSAGTSPGAGYPLAQDTEGSLRYAAIPYVLVGTEAANDIINLVKLPKGVVVHPAASRIVCEDPGTALTIDIGFASNDDALCDGAALTTAHDVTFTGAASVTAVAAQYTPAALAAGDETIFATVKTATSLTAGARLLFLIAYTKP
jgi:hypothetical protein